MKKKVNKPNIVVIGGGTGTSVVLSGLKQTQEYDLTAIVVVSDSGGSTGRLRDEFGFLPVGDLRQCLAALVDGKYQNFARQLLLYRFEKGNGLSGHNLGNLILTALEDLHKTPGKAIEVASHLFRIQGQVLPITENDVQLVIEYEDGTIKIGEKHLDDPQLGGKKISSIKLSPHALLYSKAKQAITAADLIILGPGDLYASLLPNTLVRGFKPTIMKTKAKFVYVTNLMTHYSQTHTMTAQDHVQVVKHYCGRNPDYVIVNSGSISKDLLAKYAEQKEYPVINDLMPSQDYQVIEGNFISNVASKQHHTDIVPRSLLRHDATKLAKVLSSLVK